MSPVLRSMARGLVGLVLALLLISGAAQLTGCNATRAFRSAAAPASPAPQPIDCGTRVDCA